jgi:hypothetical protein
MPSTMKTKDFCLKPKVSLEYKVYPKTYYHHNHDDIQVDETLEKYIGTKSSYSILDFDRKIIIC